MFSWAGGKLTGKKSDKMIPVHLLVQMEMHVTQDQLLWNLPNHLKRSVTGTRLVLPHNSSLALIHLPYLLQILRSALRFPSTILTLTQITIFSLHPQSHPHPLLIHNRRYPNIRRGLRPTHSHQCHPLGILPKGMTQKLLSSWND